MLVSGGTADSEWPGASGPVDSGYIPGGSEDRLLFHSTKAERKSGDLMKGPHRQEAV